jgi:phage terminase large subunit
MIDGLVLDVPTAEVFLPLLGDARYQGARGGRGSGKSNFFAEQAVEEMFTQHTRLACVREIQNSIKDSVKQLIEDKINTIQAIDVETGKRWPIAPWFKITEREIVAKHTDSLAIFRGLQTHTAASIKSIEGFNRAWYEEAQTLTQRSLTLATATFREGPNTGNVIQRFSWNPEKPDDPVDALFLGAKDDPNFILVDVNFWNNPWFPDGLRIDMERDRKRDPDRYQWVWCGNYRTSSEAQVFRNFKVENFDPPPAGTKLLAGGDWGFSVDPTVGLICFIVDRTLYIWREVYQVGCEIDRTPALFDRLDPEWKAKHSDPNWQSMVRRIEFIADSARPETISYMKKHGYPNMRSAIKGAGSVEDGIEFLKSYDIVIHADNCPHTTREFRNFAYVIDKKTEQITTKLPDADNHTIDSARYAVENVRRAVSAAYVETGFY